MFSSATQPPRPRPPRHNFVVSAITFEGFKLRQKNSNKKKIAYRSEMARNAIESYLRTSKMDAGGHFVKN